MLAEQAQLTSAEGRANSLVRTPRRRTLLQPHYAGNGTGDALPVCCFSFEMPAPETPERVEPRSAVVLGRSPLRLNPTLMFGLVQGRVKRSVANPQHIAGNDREFAVQVHSLGQAVGSEHHPIARLK